MKVKDLKPEFLLSLLLRRAPRALEGDPRERQHPLGVGGEEWGQRPTEVVVSLHNRHVGSAVGVYLDRKRDRRRRSARGFCAEGFSSSGSQIANFR